MGLVARSMRAVVPSIRDAAASTIPIWQAGTAQLPGTTYEVYAREGYQKNELVLACIEELATSAAEPRTVGRVGGTDVADHDLIRLLNRPNPFLTRFQFWATIIMHLHLAGNAYVEKVRSRAGKVVQLWVLRPDRVRVVPDPVTYIGSYEYRIGAERISLPVRDLVHFKMRHPLDDYYGMPPLMAAAGRVDVDNYMRDFVKAFFQNAGVPAGLLTIKQRMTAEQKAEVKGRFRNEFHGPRGWHDLLILDQAEATFQPMTSQLGQRGLVYPDLDAITEARIAMVFGVPLGLVGAKLGMASSSYANRKSDRESFWDETLAPLYRMLAETIDTFLLPDFTGLDEVLFDMSDVRALQEDIDKIHKRVRDNYLGGVITKQEARCAIGFPADAEGGEFLLPRGTTVELDTAVPAGEAAAPAGTGAEAV